MVLFLQADYPITYAVLKSLNISAETSDGRATVPNLVQFLDMSLKKDEDTFNNVVSIFSAEDFHN